MVIELFPRLQVLSFLLFGFAVCTFERSPDGARSSRESVCQPDQSQDAVGAELLVEPLSTEQTDENAQRQLEANSSVSANTFPVLLHKCSQWIESDGRLAWRSVGGQSVGQSACYRRAMRRAGFALGLALLVTGHAAAVEPGSPSPPAKNQPPAAPKAAPAATPAGQAPAAPPGAAPASPGDTPPPEFYVEPP